MGGGVNGGDVFGSYPELALGTDLMLGGGLLIPTTSADEYFAELALWYGASESDVFDIFPNLHEFHVQGSNDPIIGAINY